MKQIISPLRSLIHKVLATDRGSRTLQLAGMVRFVLIFIQGVVLVKAGVPLAIVGQVEFVFFLANFMMFYWQTGGQNGMLSWVPDEQIAGGEDRKLGAVFTAVHVFALVAAIVLILVFQVEAVRTSSEAIGSNDIWLLALYVLFTLPTSPIIYNYLIRKQFRKILWYIAVSYTLQISAVLIPMLMGMGIREMLSGLVIFAFVRWVFVLVDGKWLVGGLPSRKLVGAFMLFSLPLVLHALNSGLMDYVDGWIVSWFFGDELFAVYRYGAKELPINALLIGGLLSGMIPKYSAAGGVDAVALRAELRKLIMTLFPFNCLLIVVSPLIFEFVYSSDFILSARIFNIYALTLLSRIIINQVFLYVHKLNWILALSTTAEIVINVILSVIFLQKLGLLGIPLATVVAYFAHKLFLIFYIRQTMSVRLVSYLPGREFAIAVVAMVASFCFAEYMYFQ